MLSCRSHEPRHAAAVDLNARMGCVNRCAQQMSSVRALPELACWVTQLTELFVFLRGVLKVGDWNGVENKACTAYSFQVTKLVTLPGKLRTADHPRQCYVDNQNGHYGSK